MAEKNRTFQVLTVIGILSVIMGHVDLDTFPLMNTWFTPYSYHMALFVFISGYFYKENNMESIQNALEYTKKKILHLLLPLFVTNIGYGILVYLLSYKGFEIGAPISGYSLFLAPFFEGPVFVYNMCGWFVMPLFLVQMLVTWLGVIQKKSMGRCNYVRKQGKSFNAILLAQELCAFGIALLLGMCGIKMAISGEVSTLQLLYIKTSFFAVFFLLGGFYRKYLEKIDNVAHVIYFGILLLLQFCILHFCDARLDYVISNGKQFENGVIIPFVTAATGIAFYLRIARILSESVKESKVIDLICKHSYSIMMHQFLGFMTVKGLIGLGQKLFGIFMDFSIPVMKVNIWYYYFPKNTAAFGVFYILGGLVIPIVLGEAYTICRKRISP